ncbi:hypothetical protein [Robiginitalea sp. SC105]|uniref:hypothetical protein n=1 Tax=Robiginitalea sp. SC105 TaxID=2762332 RepID=UPI00163B025C|nr:hypothetical protein [Robiginitalea sp. SC105]MBC2839822.1 hypothetical protein [Robiginitalea sp. SC105]
MEKKKEAYYEYEVKSGRLYNFLRPFYDNGSSVTWHERNQPQDPVEEMVPAEEEDLFN